MNFKVFTKSLVYKVALVEWFAWAFLEFCSIVIIFAQNLRQSRKRIHVIVFTGYFIQII